jgi:hypothetical protein
MSFVEEWTKVNIQSDLVIFNPDKYLKCNKYGSFILVFNKIILDKSSTRIYRRNIIGPSNFDTTWLGY